MEARGAEDETTRMLSLTPGQRLIVVSCARPRALDNGRGRGGLMRVRLPFNAEATVIGAASQKGAFGAGDESARKLTMTPGLRRMF